MKKIFGALILCAIMFAGCDKNEEKQAVEMQETASLESIEADIKNAEVYLDESKDESQGSQDAARALYKKCIACHGAKGDKVAPGSVAQTLIANLPKNEIISSLKGYRAKTLSKGGTAAIMFLQASDLSDEDIEILGEYISNF